MAQFARPSSDISAGSWRTTPLWSKIDDAVGSGDGDFITINQNTNGSCEVALGAITEPNSGTRTLRVRARKSSSGGNARTVALNLKQGGSTIQSLGAQTLTENFQTFSLTVTASITNYADLSVEIVAAGTVTGAGGNRRAVDVADVEFETPDGTVEYDLDADTASVAVTGSNAGLISERLLDADSASVVISAQDAELDVTLPSQFPTIQSYAQATSDASDLHSFELPAGVQENDLLLFFASQVNSGSVITEPSGWTKIDPPTSDAGFHAYWKIAGSSEPDFEIEFNSAEVHLAATILRITGHDPAQPPRLNEWVQTGGNNVVDPHDFDISDAGVSKNLWIADWFYWDTSVAIVSGDAPYTQLIPPQNFLGFFRFEVWTAEEETDVHDPGEFTWDEAFSAANYHGLTVFGGEASAGASLNGETLSVAATPQDAELAKDSVVSADTASVAVTPQDAALAKGFAFPADTANVSITGQDASAIKTSLVEMEELTLGLEFEHVVLSRGVPMTADTESVNITAQDATLLPGRATLAETLALILSPQDVAFTRQLLLMADTMELNIVGGDVAAVKSRVLSLETASVAASANDVDIAAQRILIAETLSVSITAQDAELVQDAPDPTLDVDTAQVDLSFSDATLSTVGTLSVDTATVNLQASDASMIKDSLVEMESATVSLTGFDVSALASRVLSADTASFTVSASNTEVEASRALTGDTANISVTAQEVATDISRLLSADTAAILLTAQNATLQYDVDLFLVADTSAVGVAFSAASLLSDRGIDAESLTVALDAGDVEALADHVLGALTATYAATMGQADLLADRVLLADTAGLVVTPQDTDLEHGYNMLATPAGISLTFDNIITDAERALSLDTMQMVIGASPATLFSPGQVSFSPRLRVGNYYLKLGPIEDGQVYQRSGNELIGVDP